MKKTLKEILIKEQATRTENGAFGVKECKESIKWEHDTFNKSYYEILEHCVERVNKDPLYNSTMVLACWELINE